MKCRDDDCQDEAVYAMMIELWPVKAVMDHYRRYEPLSRSVLTLEFCKKHGEAIKLDDFAPADQLENLARIVELRTGTMVDRQNIKCFAVSVNDPNYLLLRMNIAQEAAHGDRAETGPATDPSAPKS